MEKVNNISDVNHLDNGKEKFRKGLQVLKNDEKQESDFLEVFKEVIDNRKNKKEEKKDIDER